MPPCVDENQIEPDLDSSRDSSSFERLLELALIADLTQEAWFGRHQIVDVLHSTVDAFRHDVVLECGQVLRHVQIKGRAMNGTTTRYKINTRLADRPSGCVIWLGFCRSPDRGPRRPALATDSAQFRGCFRTWAEPTPLGGIMARLWLSRNLDQRAESKNRL